MIKKHCASLLGLLVIQAFSTVLRADQAPAKSTSNLIAHVRQRVNADKLEVRVYKGNELVKLETFTDFYAVTPLPGPSQMIENLLKNRSVAIVRSAKNPDQWDVYRDVGVGIGKEPTLGDTLFKVKQILVSTPQSLIELRIDKASQLTTDSRKPHATEIIRLNPGDALLVL